MKDETSVSAQAGGASKRRRVAYRPEEFGGMEALVEDRSEVRIHGAQDSGRHSATAQRSVPSGVSPESPQAVPPAELAALMGELRRIVRELTRSVHVGRPSEAASSSIAVPSLHTALIELLRMAMDADETPEGTCGSLIGQDL